MSDKCSKFFYGNCPIIKQENEDLMKEFLFDLKNLPSLTMGGTRTAIMIPDFFDLIMKWEGRSNAKT